MQKKRAFPQWRHDTLNSMQRILKEHQIWLMNLVFYTAAARIFTVMQSPASVWAPDAEISLFRTDITRNCKRSGFDHIRGANGFISTPMILYFSGVFLIVSCVTGSQYSRLSSISSLMSLMQGV